ncbi:MAG: NAD(P)-dependent oxidoreductase [Bacteroidetes bacterium]|nr:NAD(P)-dependent oxidoreductase [Bacteroidota bacterium]
MRIVVTGGGGYIGARLSVFLANNGHDVIPVCFPKLPKDQNWVSKMYRILRGDIRDEKTINNILKCQPEALIHLVSLDHYDSEKDPNQVASTNVMPTWAILEKVSKIGLKRFIYFSTIHVYGNTLTGLITEGHLACPNNAYGLTHYLSEEICNYYTRNKNIECINVRLSNSYGEPIFKDANCWDLVINDLCLNAFKSKKIILKGDGSPLRDFVHYETICQYISVLLECDIHAGHNTINISSGISVSMLQVAEVVRSVFQKRYNRPIDIFLNKNKRYYGDTLSKNQSLIISNELLKSINTYRQIPLEIGIEKIFTYLDTNSK